MIAHAGRRFDKAVERYDKVIALLDWGLEEWHGVPDRARGVVFSDTFIRGVRSLRLQAYGQVSRVLEVEHALLMYHTVQALYMPDKDPELIQLDGLWASVKELSDEVTRAGPLDETDPGFLYPFFFNIVAEALA